MFFVYSVSFLLHAKYTLLYHLQSIVNSAIDEWYIYFRSVWMKKEAS